MLAGDLTEQQRKIVNAVSDVVANRPPPLRRFDQIYMKTADMLRQVVYVSRVFADRRVVFIGDGDGIALCLVYLHSLKLLECGPKWVCVLDFDERIVDSIHSFAGRHKLENFITAELYNVVNPLPEVHWAAYDAFYTNPPFGASNGGKSVRAFARRAIEASLQGAVGCLVLADDPGRLWTQEVLFATENYLLQEGFVISALVPSFHQYHLDDEPDLSSCTLVVRRLVCPPLAYRSSKLDPGETDDFYGRGQGIRVEYIRSAAHTPLGSEQSFS